MKHDTTMWASKSNVDVHDLVIYINCTFIFSCVWLGVALRVVTKKKRV